MWRRVLGSSSVVPCFFVFFWRGSGFHGEGQSWGSAPARPVLGSEILAIVLLVWP